MARPEITVAIPTLRRSEMLCDALESILCQRADCRFEILVLDNGCDPALERCVAGYQSQTPVPLRYIPVPAAGLHNGRHTGAKAARGDLVIFVDDDIIAQPQWLQSIWQTFAPDDVHLVGCRYLPAYDDAPPRWLDDFWTTEANGLRWCAYLSLLDWDDRPHDLDPAFVWGVSYAIRKRTLVELGGFHPDAVPWELRRYRGDGESALSAAVKQAGLRAVYCPAAAVRHRVPRARMRVEYFERRAFLQGISDSFSAIRSQREHAASQQGTGHALRRWTSSICSVAAGAMQWAFGQTRRGSRFPEVHARVARAYREGYDFHQAEVHHDRDLLAWVLRPHFWDADPGASRNTLPPGEGAEVDDGRVCVGKGERPC